MSAGAENAVLVLANNYQFRSEQVVSYRQVMSRMFLWCRGGAGRVSVNGRSFDLGPGDFLMIPWRHSITYVAARRNPFLVAGIHVIPDHARSAAVAFGVAHTPDHPLSRSPYRADTVLAGLDTVRAGRLSAVPDMLHLAEFCVLSYEQARGNESYARGLGQVFLTAVTAALSRAEANEQDWPEQLQRMAGHVRSRIAAPLSLRDLCAFSGLSPSAVGRLFVKHAGVTPVRFITERKLAHARGLLTTTSLPIAEVGARVGVAELSYFSKLFRKHMDCSPLQYRQRAIVSV